MSAPDYAALAAELKRRLKKTEADPIGPQDAEFERLAKMPKAALAKELRDLRKELCPKAIGKMMKHELVNEILRAKFMIEKDEHVPHSEDEVKDLMMGAPKKGVERRGKLSASKLTEKMMTPPPDRKKNPLLDKVWEIKKAKGISLKEAWAEAKAGAKPAASHGANPDHLKELAASRPKAHLKEEAAAHRAKAKHAAKMNPKRAELAALMKKGLSFSEAAAKLHSK